MAVHPLLPLSQTRVQDESRVAADIARAHFLHRRRIHRLVLLCLGEYLIGLSAMGLGLRIWGGDLAHIVFDAGLLIGVCGPIWTVLLTMWLEENRR